jgi:hypothetical protein
MAIPKAVFSSALGADRKRREFITLFGGTAAMWPFATRAQQPTGRVYRVGYLAVSSREQQLHFKAFEDGLRSLGYRVGENIAIEYRFADGQMESNNEDVGTVQYVGVHQMRDRHLPAGRGTVGIEVQGVICRVEPELLR